MSAEPELTVVTVLYGGEAVLVETLPTWSAAAAGLPISFVLIDNSPGSTAASVASQFLPDAEAVLRPSNPGFAASANEGLLYAHSDWALLLNADVYLTPAAVQACLDWVAAPERDAASECAAISLVTAGQELCGVEIDAVGYFSDRPAASSRPPLGPSGGAMLIHRSLLEKTGGFDADLFAWGEDAGLSLRLTSAGVRTHTLRLRLDHVGGHSVASLAGQRFKARLLARNRIRVMRRDWTLPLRLVLGPPQVALMVANGFRKLAYGTSQEHFRGLLEGLLEQRTVERSGHFGLSSFLRYRAARSSDTGMVR